MTTSDIDISVLEQKLATARIGHSVRILPQIDSTNEEIKRRLAINIPEGTVVIADLQTQGRGRQGRSWHSEPGAGLYLSTFLKPPLTNLSCIPLMVGVATSSAIQQQTSVPVKLKWPNDILINGKKLAGILCECIHDSTPALIIGVGVNLNHTRFPADLQGIATSLKLETGKDVNRADLVLSLLQNLDSEYENFLQGNRERLIRKWTENSDLFGKTVTVFHKGKALTGTAIGLDPQGKLILQNSSGEQQIFDSGEVSFQRVTPG